MARSKNIKKLLATLTLAEIEQLQTMLKKDPRIAKLEKRLAELDGKREILIAEIENLKGGNGRKKRSKTAETAKGKPRRPKKIASTAPEETVAKKRRGRAPMVEVTETVAAPKKRARPTKIGVSTPEMRASEAKAVKKKARTPEEQAKIDARMAKARAARGKTG